MTSGRECSAAVKHALEAGYKAVDSAEWYENEKEVGSAISTFIKENGGKREDIWFTTKLKDNRGYDATRKKIKESVKKSGLGYLDLYLLHSPYGGKQRRLDCWRAVEDAVLEGEVRAGGVSNFGIKHVGFYLPPPLRLIAKFTIVTRDNKRETQTRTSHQPNRSPPIQYTNRHHNILQG